MSHNDYSDILQKGESSIMRPESFASEKDQALGLRTKQHCGLQVHFHGEIFLRLHLFKSIVKTINTGGMLKFCIAKQ